MLTRYTKKFIHYLRHTRAVSALEYALLVGIIVVAMAAAMATFTDQIEQALTDIGTKVGNTKTAVSGTT